MIQPDQGSRGPQSKRQAVSTGPAAMVLGRMPLGAEFQGQQRVSCSCATFLERFVKKTRLPVALSVLVNRVVSSGYVRNAAAPELVDVLFALTSFSFFAELTAGGRPVEIVCRIIQNLSADAVDDGLEGERITIASLLLFGGQVAHPLLSVFNNEEA